MSDDPIDSALSSLGQLLIETELARPDQLRGCTGGEIKQISDLLGRPLPPAYALFLAHFGRGAGDFWRGSTVFYPDMLRLLCQEGLAELAQEMDVALPAQDRLVFFSHQGYDYLWLDLSSGAADPPVWELFEGSPQRPEQVSATFTGLLLDRAAQLARDLARLRASRQ